MNENTELLPVLDDNLDIIGKAPRSDFHYAGGDKLLHPVVHLHVFNKKGEIFLQLRPENKLIQPGKWDTAVGGHVAWGETIEEALKREAEEEIGLKDFKAELVKEYLWETKAEKEWVYMFKCIINKPLCADNEEVSDGRYWNPEEIKASLGKEVFTGNFEHEICQFMRKST